MIKTLIVACGFLLAQMAAAQTCKDSISASTPDIRFVINGDEVTDTETSLIWQRCTLGKTESDCSGGNADTYTWQQALQAATPPWRLPNGNELRSIVEEKCYDPAINLTAFPNTIPSYYWSASPDAWGSMALGVEFFNGGAIPDSTGDVGYIRLVRDGQ